MASKLYVGGLPYATNQESLRSHFEQVGEVTSAIVITDRETGRSKGFGFVEMGTPELAENAIEKFDGTDFEGRTIRVNIAKERAPRPPRNGGPGNRY